MWNKKILYTATVISAISNFFVSILYLKMMGLESFGLLMMYRSAIQLTSNINFATPYGLVLFISRRKLENKSKYIDKLHYLTNISMYIWSIIYFILWIFIVIFMNIELLLGISLIFFGFSVLIYSYFSQVAKAYRNGKKILYSAIIDIIAILFMVFILLWTKSMLIFIYSLGIRFYLKAYFLYIPIKYKHCIKIQDIKKLKYLSLIGFVLMLKGWVQTAQQYADKLLYGMLFSPKIAGILSLGSMFALPVIMYISVISTLIISKSKSKDICQYIKKEYMYIFISFIIVFILIVLFKPIIKYFFNIDNFILFIIGIYFILLLNIYTPLTNFMYIKLFFKESILIGLKNLFIVTICLIILNYMEIQILWIFIILDIILGGYFIFIIYKYKGKLC